MTDTALKSPPMPDNPMIWSALDLKPDLGWIALDKMIVDETYQRTTQSRRSAQLIDKMVREFSWRRFQPLILSPRHGGMYAIIDGQHKREAAMRLGMTDLPCMIVAVTNIQQEADAFVSVNADRVAVTPLQLHHSMCAAGDRHALQIQAVCSAAGVKMARYPIEASRMPPKTTVALGAIDRAIGRYGDIDTTRALKVLAEAFPTERGQFRSNVIKGLAFFFSKHQPGSYDHTRVRQLLADMDMVAFDEAAMAYRKMYKTGADEAIYAAVVKYYNRNLKDVTKKLGTNGIIGG